MMHVEWLLKLSLHGLGVSALGMVMLLSMGCTSTGHGGSRSALDDIGKTVGGGRWMIGEVLYQDAFDGSLDRWRAELEKGGRVEASGGKLVIEVPGGCSVWFEPMLAGPVMIEYDATVIGNNGPNDRVSDLNCFWMARDARNMDDIFAVKRSGQFSEYNQLKCYYVGYGGNTNSTTRFRRYIGDAERRPLLPEHDLSDKPHMIEANRTIKIRCVAAGGRIEYWRDGELVFSYDDPEPYTSGWFAFRTVMSHIEIDNFKVYRLAPKS